MFGIRGNKLIDINMTLVAQVLNFLILVVILRLVAYKPIMKMLKAREEKIAKSIDAAEADEKKAKELLEAYNKPISRCPHSGTGNCR